MTRGRKPKPTAQKLLAGNPGKRALNKSEPTPPPGVPSCPAHMADDERQVWFEIAGSAVAMNVLTQADAVSFEVLVRAIARYRRGMQQIITEGEVIKCGKIKMKSPWLSVVKDAEAIINTYGAKFGLSPADRSRIQLPEGKKEEDPLEALLNRARKQTA